MTLRQYSPDFPADHADDIISDQSETDGDQYLPQSLFHTFAWPLMAALWPVKGSDDENDDALVWGARHS